MLERLSIRSNHDGHGSVQKQSKLRDRSSLFGNKKQAAFHVVISELRAELMNSKHHSTNYPCVLMWIRGETIHVTDESVGQKVLSWSDTYFAQLVTLQPSSSGGPGSSFRPKECKFKVQQRGKTIAKTAVLDLAKYCSDAGLAREQSVAMPLTPCGTLYFVISTALANEQLQPQDSSHRHSCSQHERQHSASAAVSTAAGGLGGGECNQSTTSKFTGTAAAAAAAAAVAGTPGRGGDAASEDGDRPSRSSAVRQQQLPSSSGSRPPPPTPLLPPSDSEGLGFFRRMGRAGSKQRLDITSGGGGGGGTGSPQQAPRHRKSESAQLSGISANVPWDRVTLATLAPTGSGGGGGGSPATAGACSPATRRCGSGALASASSAPYLHAADGGATGATSARTTGNNLERCSVSNSRASSSDTGAGAGGGVGASRHAGSVGGDDVGRSNGGGGNGWGAWLRGGLGWGRSSNHSATGTSTSQASLHGGPSGGGGGGGGGEPESSAALETAIGSCTDAAELRELALDMLHERDAWRSRALAAQDACGRAQTARGSAVREAQRLEVRLRQYQDELGRRTDGSLLQELVEAKVRIAELANENMKLRRQITHMGPLFYDDSGDEGGH
ncbi:hypothetical protein Agub_g15743 [Astrephomene gubernaculifera]|uniref:C2 NT-type domain-containing protein n=1 Tax=Astrephomene gubernaculifera TaxID=47775 RepID=A0AAD3HTY1_9CHLO|nr:hypothetical protein Agub_g15743 [Astrephomene gubernaculifera]